MHFFVSSKKATLSERNATHIAHKWTFAGMHSFVQCLGVFHFEAFGTVRAFVWECLLLVNQKMFLKVLLGFVGFSADIANQLEIRVRNGLMLVKRVIRSENFVAKITRIDAGFLVDLTHMLFVFFTET